VLFAEFMNGCKDCCANTCIYLLTY